MNNHHSEYIEALIRRTESLLNGVRSHFSGSGEIQKNYTLDYLCANLVEQTERMKRLQLSDDKSGELTAGFTLLLEERKFEMMQSAIRGAEPGSLLSLFKNVLRSAQQMLEEQQNAETEQEIYDQLADCLVKRDDLFLIEHFIRAHTADFSGEEANVIRNLFSGFTGLLSVIDRSFKEQAEVFSLAEKFCREYTSSNRLTDENRYWWFYEPIRTAEEAGIVSAMSIDLVPDKNIPGNEVADAAAAINANVRFRRLMLEEKNKEKHDDAPFELSHIHTSAVYEPRGEYSSKPAARLIPGIYVFTVNSKTTRVDHCLLTGAIDAKPAAQNYPAEYLDNAAQKIISEIPAIAAAIHALPQKNFTVELAHSPDGWCGASIGLPAYVEYLRLSKFLNIGKPVAASGIIGSDGAIHRVEEIQQKVERAIVAGFEIIIVPEENKKELHRALQRHRAVFFAGTIEEAVRVLKKQ